MKGGPPDYRQLASLLWAMPALSIRQPWAHRILSGETAVENRPRATNLRGWFLIHAAQSDEEAPDLIRSRGLPRGGIVGAAMIADCVTWSSDLWFSGPYAWVLRQPFSLPFTPCRGRQGFFHPPRETLACLTRDFQETLHA